MVFSEEITLMPIALWRNTAINDVAPISINMVCIALRGEITLLKEISRPKFIKEEEGYVMVVHCS